MSADRVARPAVLRDVPRDRHAVIEASAGTGKTFTLEHLVVDLILSADVPLERLLVVTFTEKATQELRARVRGKLEDLLARRAPAATDEQIAAGDFWTLDAPARARLTAALHAFDGATIATIHAFCQRVLRDNAFAGGRLFEEQQVDGRASFGQALRETLRRDVARDPVKAAWLEAALRAGFSMEAIEALLWSCHTARGELRPVLDAAELDAAIAAFPVDDVLGMTSPEPLRALGLHPSRARALGSRLHDLALAVERARATDARELVVGAGAVDVEYVQTALEDVTLGASLAGRIGAAALRLARATPTLPSALATTIYPAIQAELARQKRRAGHYDFDDMLSLVGDALRGPRAGAMARAMRERWSHVLIDEFQDTDETQWDIFRRAFFEPAPGPRSVVVLVGDPKQSIYRFRGADVQTYLHARGAVEGAGGARLRIDRSFRATGALVEATNALFDPAAGEPLFQGAVTYEPVACGRPDRALRDGEGRAVAPVVALRFEGEVALSALGARVAREIRAVTDPAAPLRLDGAPLAHRDVFVLTRTKSEARAMGASLRAAGVPHAFFKEDGLFQSDEAREILTLLSAILAPGDRARRLAAWMTSFFGLPLEDLERARELPATHPYMARLAGWKALADARDFERLFESVVVDSGVLRREIFFATGERELTNLLHVFELLLEHARRTPCSLEDLVLQLSGLVDGTRLGLDLEGNVQRLESERQAVQIMTVHKAKGLEAAVVFVAGGFSPGPSGAVRVYHDGGRRFAWVGPAPEAIKERAAQEEREEDQRLMYVALTRAKGRLYLPLAVKDGAPARLRGPYAPVNRRVFELVRGASPLVAVDAAPALAAVAGGAGAPAALEGYRPPTARFPAAVAGDHAALRARAAGAVLTSYTRMAAIRTGARSAWSDDAAERRDDKGADEVDGARESVLRSARTSGVFVHEVLERVPLETFAAPSLEAWRARPDVAALFDETVAVHRVDPAQRGHAEQLVWRAFTTRVALPDGGAIDRLADAARVVRELEFVFPVQGADAFVRGSLDVAFEHGGRTYFADWKTDSLPSFAPGALRRHVEDHYGDQIALYTLALAKLLGLGAREAYEARFGGLCYVFLRGLDARGAGLHAVRPPWEALATWERGLGARAQVRP